jgi:hypothetical protein
MANDANKSMKTIRVLQPAHNSKYVFAISSRYNANDSVKGRKETSDIIERNRAARPHLYAE